MNIIIVALLFICATTLFSDPTKHYDNPTVLFTESECNLDGGLNQGCWINSYLNSDVWSDGYIFGLDENLKLDLSVAGILSKEPSVNYIGDFQTASNIDAPSQLLLYNASLSYKFEKLHNLELSAGLIDLNTIYDVTQSASVLINSSFGISAGLSANGAFSIYPVPGYALNAAMQLDSGSLNAGIFDANPTKRYKPFSDGYFSIIEWDHSKENNYNISLGAWQSSTSAGSTHGFYTSIEKNVFKSTTAFLRLASSDGVATVVPFAFETGVLSNAVFSSRKDDIFSAGIAQARFQNNTNETAYEATYLWQQNHYLGFQPDLQYVQHISGFANNAMIAIFRVIITYDNQF